jgi:hypothetical protein
MGAAELFTSVAGLPLPQAAARLAAVGMPVFPCVPGGKRPLVEHGFHEATTDAGQVAAWWRRWPSANIGLPTGRTSGVEVVDVDRKASGSGFSTFARAREAGLVGGWLAAVCTPSGGAHFYFPTAPDRPQPSWQAAKARIDFRGEGGYVIVPPSAVITGELRAGYVLAGGAGSGAGAVDATALRDFLDPRPEPSVTRARGVVREGDADRLAAWVALRGEGERNRGLFWAACRLAEAGIDPAVTLDVLGPAAEQAGLPPREVVVTIRSAYRAALAAPRTGAASGHGETARNGPRVSSRVLS